MSRGTGAPDNQAGSADCSISTGLLSLRRCGKVSTAAKWTLIS